MNQPIIDVNINLSHWPTRRVPGDEPSELAAMLKSRGVTQAWAGSFDGLLHKDLAAVNQRLAAQCAAVRDVQLLPFGSINPLAPDWPEDVRRCDEMHHMRGVRVHPNYHGYALEHPNFAELLTLCEARRLIVILPVQMEDERVMHPLLRVKPVDVAPLHQVLARVPNLRLVMVNASKALLINKIAGLAKTFQVYADISTVDGLAVIEEIVRDMPLDRILFGSHAPLFYFESALLKLREAELTQAATRQIQYDNAAMLIER